MDREKLQREQETVVNRPDKKDEGADLAREGETQTDREGELYGSTVAAMESILGESPQFDAPINMPPDVVEALEQLYAAKTAVHESVGDGHVSAMERMKALNVSLANLRPILSAGLKPGHDDPTREILGERVTELRAEIKQTIYKEAVPPLRRKDEEEEEDAGDEDDGDDEGDGEGNE